MAWKQLKKNKKSQQEIQEEVAERKEQLSTKRTAYYPNMRAGGNVFMIIPNIGGGEPFKLINYHAHPKMLCGLPEPVLDKSKKGGADTAGPWLPGCKQCNEVWDTYKESGKDSSLTAGFKAGKSKPYMIVQCIQLTPFFDFDGRSYKPKMDADKYFDTFAEYVLAKAKRWAGEDVELPEFPEDTPEDILYAAEAGIGFLRLKQVYNAEYGVQMRDKWLDIKETYGSLLDDPDFDPVYEPEKYLMTIDRVKTGTNTNGNGDEFPTYSTKFNIVDMSKAGWELPEAWEEFFEGDNYMRYFRNLESLNDGMENVTDIFERGYQLCRLTPNEVDALHEDYGYKPYSGKEFGGDEDDIPGESEDLAPEQRGKIDQVKERIKARKKKKEESSAAPESSDLDEIDEDDIPF